MISVMNINRMINLMSQEGMTIRKACRICGVSRNVFRKYWRHYCDLKQELLLHPDDPDLQKKMQNFLLHGIPPKPRKRKKTAFTSEVKRAVEQLLREQEEKDALLGPNKQYLSKVRIHEILTEELGFNISYATLAAHLPKRAGKKKEVYIPQNHEPAASFQMDYGEVKLIIAGKKKKACLAVFALPYSNLRFAYLYEKQDLPSFVKALNRFFHDLGGVPKEGVFDNMKNAFAGFQGKEKEINETLLNLANWYGFHVRLCNFRSGNEKSHVERAVSWARRLGYDRHYQFDSFEEADRFLQQQIRAYNSKGVLDELKLDAERSALDPLCVKPFPFALWHERKADKTSMVTFNNVRYSVPEEWSEKMVRLRQEDDWIHIQGGEHIIASHRVIASGESINPRHYIETIKKKPGSLKSSKLLRNNPAYKSLTDSYCNGDFSLLIEFLDNNRHLDDHELEPALAAWLAEHQPAKPPDPKREDPFCSLQKELDGLWIT